MTTLTQVSNKHALGVVTGSDPGPHSGVWRIFTYGDDICVQPRYTGGAVKTSFHSSGLNRHAYAQSGSH